MQFGTQVPPCPVLGGLPGELHPAPVLYWRDCDLSAFVMGVMVPHPPGEKSRKRIQHLLRVGILATSPLMEYARNTVVGCTVTVRSTVVKALSREHACEIVSFIAQTGRTLINTWSTIVIPHIRATSSRGDRRAPDHFARIERANELFLKDYVSKLENFVQRVLCQRHITLQDVLTALVLVERIANIPRLG